MIVAVRYHEIALKGRNRPVLRGQAGREPAPGDRRPGRARGARAAPAACASSSPTSVPWEPVRERIGTVFGRRQLLARARRRRPTSAALTRGRAGDGARPGPRARSASRARRSDKGFPLVSLQIERELGAAIQQAHGRARGPRASRHSRCFVEVLRDRILYSFERLPGAGRLPGRQLGPRAGAALGRHRLAGGRLAHDEARLHACVLVHFHAFPLQDHTTIDKARELARDADALPVPHAACCSCRSATVQQTIVAPCPAPLRVVLYRRFMLRIAEALARAAPAPRRWSPARAWARSPRRRSTTWPSSTRPRAARAAPAGRHGQGGDHAGRRARIGTFEISTLPDQDCCQLFVPEEPGHRGQPLETCGGPRPPSTSPALVEAAVKGTRGGAVLLPRGRGRGRRAIIRNPEHPS